MKNFLADMALYIIIGIVLFVTFSMTVWVTGL